MSAKSESGKDRSTESTLLFLDIMRNVRFKIIVAVVCSFKKIVCHILSYLTKCCTENNCLMFYLYFNTLPCVLSVICNLNAVLWCCEVMPKNKTKKLF